MRRLALSTAQLLLVLLSSQGSVAAAEREYGIAAGLGTLLAPTDTLGASLGFSAAASPSWGGRRLVRARGELEAFIGDGAWAVLPTITGDAGLRLNRWDLYFTGGVEIFGFARRSSYTMFANLGLVGGGGLAFRITPRLRVGARALLVWLIPFSSVKLSAPEGAEKPNYLSLGGLLSLEILGGEVPDDLDFD